ncbi:hypothetical protein OG206_29955 [Streptomyces sp. NBC_01341]|uniref:hypothetical protein n=1 Tax=Streptomyces sp. NBC_01341 TaxID=2903831 RepID=UPI002E156902|nr:hypothetical protein OG206_29955 [Streptomyces sp. NBC_01341]
MTDHSDPRTEPASPTEPRRTTVPGTPRESANGAGTTREPAVSRETATGTGLTPGVTRESATDERRTPETTPDTPAGTSTGDGRDRSVKDGTRAGLGTPVASRKAPGKPSDERSGHREDHDTDRPLVSRDDQEKLSQRMQQAVSDFVESPRRAVEEADSTFDQIVSGLTEALTERRRVLRVGWQEQDTEAQTEELRIALQRYRDLSEQLLKI